MMNQPMISVIIPLFNSEKYIKDALESVFKQNYPNIEVIVINDGSTDNSLKIVEEFNKVIIISQKNQGTASAKNRGIEKARGSILAFLDADDLWPDNHIKCMLPYLDNSIYDIVRGYTQLIKVNENILDDIEYSEKLFFPAVIATGLYKKDIFDRIGLFDEEMRQGEDADWVNRFTESSGNEKKISDTTLFYRKHENNMTNSLECLKKGMFDAIKKKFQRYKEIK